MLNIHVVFCGVSHCCGVPRQQVYFEILNMKVETRCIESPKK